MVECPASGDPCKVNTCDKAKGTCAVQMVAADTACDDGDACTANDVCQGGACSGGKDTCACSKDSDCEDVDGDPCTGIPYCNKAGGKGKCENNPASVVVCSQAADTDCRKNACDKSLGACKLTPVADNTTCSDGDACTKGEACVGGTCAAGTDTCKCASDKDCVGADDGNLCNGLSYCNKASGKCETNPATVVFCPTVDDTACTKNVCDPKLGVCAPQPRSAVNQAGCQLVDLGGGVVAQFCLYLAAEGGKSKDAGPFLCEDGDACTKGDACEGKACKPGAKVCQCSSDADCKAKDDGNFCNGTMFCNAQSGLCEVNPSTVVSCPSVDDTACIQTKCQPKTGACLPEAVSGTCDDGDACTSGDGCLLGKCQPGTFTCACKADVDRAGSDDGDLCNGTMFCDKTGKAPACKLNPKTIVTCASVDDTACSKNTCNPKSGTCGFVAQKGGTPCDDGDACTKGDLCKLGGCAGGSFVCECKDDAGCATKDDGNLCNSTMFCDKSGAAPACKALPNSTVFCAKTDDTACLKATCDPKTAKCALQPVATGAACDDGLVCTTGELCDKGSCGGGKANQCDDKNACTIDSCDAKLGCVQTAKGCSDGNECTSEQCDSKTGNCTAPAPSTKGALCNADGKGCTVGDACDGLGACLTGSVVDCKQPSDLCKEAICQDKGGTDYACVEATRKDGSSCDSAGACKVGATCKAGVCGAATTDTLYADVAIGPTDGWTELRALTIAPGSDLYLGGRGRAKQSDAVSTNVAQLRRVTATGASVWERTYAGDAAHADTAIVDLAPALNDGVYALANLKLNSNAKVQPRLFHVDASGKTAWSVTPGISGGFEATTALAVASEPSGQAALLARDEVTCGVKNNVTCSTLIVRVVSSSGGVTATYARPLDKAIEEAFASGTVELRDESTLFVSGARSLQKVGAQARSYTGYSAVVSAAGKVLVDDGPVMETASAATRTLLIAAGDAYAVRLFTSPHATQAHHHSVLAGLEQSAGSAEKVYLQTIGASLTRWDAGPSTIAVTGTMTDGSSPNDVYVGILDRRANHGFWSQRLNGGSADVAGDVAFTGANRVAAVSTVVNGAASRGRLSRLSAFGPTSCSGAGVCQGKAFADCDDGKVCTVDGCNSSAGCQHPLKDEIACDVTNGCSIAASCISGSCVPFSFGNIRWIEQGPLVADDGVLDPHALVVGGMHHAAYYDVSEGQSKIQVMVASPDYVASTSSSVTAAAVGGPVPALKGPLKLVYPGGTAAHPKEEFLMYGRLDGGSPSATRAVFVRRGSQNWAYLPCGASVANCAAIPVEIFEAPTGLTWIFFTQTSSSSTYAHAVRLTKGGANSSVGGAFNSHSYALSSPQEAIMAAALRGDGGFVWAIGRTQGLGSPNYVTVEARAYDTKVAIFPAFDIKPAGSLTAFALASTDDGGALLVGELIAISSGLRSGYVARVSSAGKLSWQSLPAQPDGRIFTSLIQLQDRTLVGGAILTSKTGSFEAFLGAIHHAGTRLWERNLGATGAKTAASGVGERNDGGIDFAYVHRIKGESADRLRLVRTDKWGHSNCTVAGKCGAVAAQDCDDGNPCTVDVCDATTGCSSTKTSGGLCATGKICKAGVCAAP